jgi:hypothetical protein
MALILNGTDGLSDVDGTASTPAIRGTDTNTGIFFPAADTIAFAEGGAEVARFDSSGNMGVGTTTPTPYNSGAKVLQVNSGVANSEIKLTNSTTGNSASVGFNLVQSGNNSYVYNASNGFMAFGTNNVERMSITTTGEVTIKPSTLGSYLAINGTTGGEFVSVGSYAPILGGSTYYGLLYNGVSGSRTYVSTYTAGVYLASSATSWTSASDERMKDIIEPITNGSEKVASLRAVIGKYKTDEEGTRRSFLIAQDVQAVLPEAVDASNPDELGVQYTDVIPLLVAAIKEQQAIITDLKARLEVLEAK